MCFGILKKRSVARLPSRHGRRRSNRKGLAICRAFLRLGPGTDRPTRSAQPEHSPRHACRRRFNRWRVAGVGFRQRNECSVDERELSPRFTHRFGPAGARYRAPAPSRRASLSHEGSDSSSSLIISRASRIASSANHGTAVTISHRYRLCPSRAPNGRASHQ